MRLAVVPVAFASEPAPATGMVAAACALFAGWSGGALEVAPAALPPLAVSEPGAHFAALGGMTALGGPMLAARARTPGPLVLVARGKFHSHCWRLPAEAGGGRYVLLPEDAPALTAAHELGHLLLGWADAPGAGVHCLMGAGTGPPGAWLRVAAGWATPTTITPATTPRALEKIGCWAGLIVEHRNDTLLAWSAADRIRTIRLAPGDQDRPILALLAAHDVHPKAPELTTRETSR